MSGFTSSRYVLDGAMFLVGFWSSELLSLVRSVEEFKNGTRMLTLGNSVIKESAGLVTFSRTYVPAEGFCNSPQFLAFDTYQAALASSVGGLTRLDFGSS
eukprot:816176-Amorphochlora_amoeboformis.AAC.1